MTLDEVFRQIADLGISFDLERRSYNREYTCSLSKNEGYTTIAVSLGHEIAAHAVMEAWRKYQLIVYGGSVAHQGLAITHEPPKAPNSVTFDDEIPF